MFSCYWIWRNFPSAILPLPDAFMTLIAKICSNFDVIYLYFARAAEQLLEQCSARSSDTGTAGTGIEILGSFSARPLAIMWW